MVDDPASEYYNADVNAAKMINYLKTLKTKYQDTGHLMVLFGDDFMYENALMAYYNLDALIESVNALQKKEKYPLFELRYSTPSDYIEGLKYGVKNPKFEGWPVKTDDFFPYADGKHKYWTGYFTSRSNLKKNIRELTRSLLSA
jgi:hypothetical protein